jgi:hypothetical protein
MSKKIIIYQYDLTKVMTKKKIITKETNSAPPIHKFHHLQKVTQTKKSYKYMIFKMFT